MLMQKHTKELYRISKLKMKREEIDKKPLNFNKKKEEKRTAQ